MKELRDNPTAIKIYDDYNYYVSLCKKHNQVCWNISDKRNFYKHFTYVMKTFGR